jgi:serine/threonine protein kinase
MAPEMIANHRADAPEWKKYGMAVDYWSLGCVVYEMETEGVGKVSHSVSLTQWLIADWTHV